MPPKAVTTKHKQATCLENWKTRIVISVPRATHYCALQVYKENFPAFSQITLSSVTNYTDRAAGFVVVVVFF